MSVSMATRLEMYTNPRDLEINVHESGGMFGIAISRGPGHNFKLLVSSPPIFENRDAAAEAIVSTMRAICRHAADVLSEPGNVLAGILNPECGPLDEDRVLNEARLNEILTELKLHGVASTYKMFVPAT